MPCDGRCSFCNYPSAPHLGGGEFNGVKVSGNFCSQECFEIWLRWKAVMIAAKMQPVPMAQQEPFGLQAVLPV